MAFSKLRHLAHVHFAAGGVLIDGLAAGRAISRGFSGFAGEADSEGAPVPAWKYWKLKAEEQELKAEHWKLRCDSHAKDYLASIRDARLEILQYKYQLRARGIPELFIRALTREAHLHCDWKAKDERLPQDERNFYKSVSENWFPQARKEIWRIILEMPTMVSFKEEMQNLFTTQDMDLLVTKATAFHKEFHYSHHDGVRQRETITFVRDHIRQGMHDRSLDPVHLEGFIQAMAKRINVNVIFVDEREVSERVFE